MTSKRLSFSNIASVCLLLISLTAFFFAVSRTFCVKAVAKAEANASVDVQKRYVTKNIEDIRIGERTLGANPQGRVADELDDSIFQTVPFCKYSLRTAKEDGSQCDIQLLRLENWLDDEITRLRRKIDGKVVDEVDLLADGMLLGELDSPDNYALDVWLELPEMAVVGWATLTNVDENVDVQNGAGNVVTGTFAHIAENAINLLVEDQKEPIGCTDNHPFWSVDRQDFVPAGELLEGERLLLYNGETKLVVQKLPRPGPQVVYNLEIYGEHVYHVSADGVLVHNNCNVFERYVSEEEALESVRRQKLVLRRDKNGSYKNIAEIGSVNPKKLGKRSSYEYRLLIETKNDPRKWFMERGIEGAEGHGNSWHIEAERLEEFNRKFVRRITMEKRPQVNARKRKK